MFSLSRWVEGWNTGDYRLSGGFPESGGWMGDAEKEAALPRYPLFPKPKPEREGFRQLRRF